MITPKAGRGAYHCGKTEKKETPDVRSTMGKPSSRHVFPPLLNWLKRKWRKSTRQKFSITYLNKSLPSQTKSEFVHFCVQQQPKLGKSNSLNASQFLAISGTEN